MVSSLVFQSNWQGSLEIMASNCSGLCHGVPYLPFCYKWDSDRLGPHNPDVWEEESLCHFDRCLWEILWYCVPFSKQPCLGNIFMSVLRQHWESEGLSNGPELTWLAVYWRNSYLQSTSFQYSKCPVGQVSPLRYLRGWPWGNHFK